MRARVLGSSAGGGLPQWNCACRNCSAVRHGSSDIEARTQDSVLVTTDDGEAAFLLNASPDILVQVARAPSLTPRALRHTPIAGVVLTSGDVDHCLGLLSLREDQPFTIYATFDVQARLRERNVLFRTLARSPDHVVWRTLELDQPTFLADSDGNPTGVQLTAFPLPGKVPRHLEGLFGDEPGDQVGLRLSEGRDVLVYASCVASTEATDPHWLEATCLLFDGTFYTSDELTRLGIAERNAEQMAHLPVSGETGSSLKLAGLTSRRIYTHVNNTNPMLVRGSRERLAVERLGWEIAHDGMELFS
jgi:pyrroloquinoline quinone biosynthesis protein B